MRQLFCQSFTFTYVIIYDILLAVEKTMTMNTIFSKKITDKSSKLVIFAEKYWIDR